MSRSRRRFPRIPGCGTPLNRKQGKKLAARKARRSGNIPDGKAYRKLFYSWRICDYRPRESLREWLLGCPEDEIEKKTIEWAKMFYWK